MSEERNLTEYIDAYLDNTLTGAEKEAFQQKVKEDPEFRLEVEAQITVRSLVAKAEKRAYFSQLEEELFNTTALIDRYLEGSMTERELEWFEQRLEEEMELRKDVEAQRMIIEAVERQEAKKKFQNLEKKFEGQQEAEQKETPVIQIHNRKNIWMAVAASIAIFISVATVFLLNRSQDQQLAQDQFIASYNINVEEHGPAVRSQPGEALEVLIVKSEKHPLHYTKQNETLIIYLKDPSLNEEDIQIEHDASAEQPYKLIIKDQAYLLEDTSEDPQPLETIK